MNFGYSSVGRTLALFELGVLTCLTRGELQELLCFIPEAPMQQSSPKPVETNKKQRTIYPRCQGIFRVAHLPKKWKKPWERWFLHPLHQCWKLFTEWLCNSIFNIATKVVGEFMSFLFFCTRLDSLGEDCGANKRLSDQFAIS